MEELQLRKVVHPTVNQSKLNSFNTSIKCKYGYKVPRNYNHAMLLDEKNGNNLWKDAVVLEL
jgi:hypothetical protein